MANYTVIGTSIRHDGKRYQEGATIELPAVPEGLSQYLQPATKESGQIAAPQVEIQKPKQEKAK